MTHKGRSFQRQRDLLNSKLEELQEQKFYGQVTLVINAGNILQVMINRSWKLKEEADGLTGKEAQADGVEDQEAAARSKHPHQAS